MKLRSGGGFERSTRTATALQAAESFLSRHGFKSRFSEVGDAIKTTRCELIGAPPGIAAGMGKGVGEQSAASAVFEAIEHLWWYTEDVTEAPVQRLEIDGPDHKLRRASPDFFKLSRSRDLPLTRVCFESLEDRGEYLHFPYILTNPFHVGNNEEERYALARSPIRRYGSNSGTASGTSKPDAILHALLEIIERDALSLALLETIIRECPAKIRRINLEHSIGELSYLLEVMAEGGFCVEVWDITSDIGIPVVLAAVSHGSPARREFGSGASLSLAYAIERAVLEGLQCLQASDLGGKRGCSPTPLGAKPIPFARCYLDGGHFDYRGGETIVERDLQLDPSINLPLTTEGQVSEVVDALSKAGLRAYARCLLNEEVCVYQVVVPEAERFHLVSSGVPVLPSWRGRRALER